MQIIEYIFAKLDKDLVFYGTYDEIAEALSASKPTVVSAFQSLIENGVLVRIKNGAYKLNADMTGLTEGQDFLE